MGAFLAPAFFAAALATALRVEARDSTRLAGRGVAARATAALRVEDFGAGVPVAMSIAAIIASRTLVAIALIASLIAAAGFATGSLTVVAGGAAPLR